jgi:type IV pilus assembly protein PilN
MRLDINLASQPYEDARQFWMHWGGAVGAAGVLTLLLLTLTVTGWINARRDRDAMAEKRALIADRDRIRTDAEEFLNRPENRSTRDQSQFLNELIERKAFSWTRVLENLEKVMPPRVHLVSINPELDDQNQLALKMTVAGDSRDRAIELARRMEESRRFAQTYITSESPLQSTNGSGDTERIEILAVYIPEPLVPATLPASSPATSPSTPPAKTDGKPADGRPVDAKPRTKSAKGSKG